MCRIIEEQAPLPSHKKTLKVTLQQGVRAADSLTTDRATRAKQVPAPAACANFPLILFLLLLLLLRAGQRAPDARAEQPDCAQPA
jgi:hypothetical protein